MPRAYRLTTAEFIERSKQHHGDKYDYSLVEYKNGATKVSIICNIHGEFKQKAEFHMDGSGCTPCARLNRIKLRTKTTEKFVSDANKVHNNRYDYSLTEYVNANTKVKIICNIHGTFEQNPNDHLNRHGCKSCGVSVRTILRSSNSEEFSEKAYKVHGNIYDYTLVKYVNSSTRVKILCKKHKLPFDQAPTNHLRGAGCPRCKASGPERDWLEYLGVPDTPLNRQVPIKIGNRTMRADGYNPITNTVYEFWGDYWHGNPKVYLPNEKNSRNGKLFSQLYNETINKRNKIITAGYTLVDIWEYDWNILKEKLYA